jgi:hypothetical protein
MHMPHTILSTSDLVPRLSGMQEKDVVMISEWGADLLTLLYMGEVSLQSRDQVCGGGGISRTG